MRFLFLNQFYPPDSAPTGRYLHDVATELVGRGHEVRVVCSRRAYATGQDLGPGDRLDGVEVERVRGAFLRADSIPGRLADHLSYFIQAAVRAALSSRPTDLVLCATSPPFLGLAGALAGRLRSIPRAEWVMDLYPDAIQAHWSGSDRPKRFAFLDALARLQLRRADLVLALGASMAGRIGRYCPSTTRIETVPLWSNLQPEESRAAELRARRGWPLESTVLLYSGHMGRGHRFGEFLEAARRLDSEGPLWTFIGSGLRRAEIEAFCRAHPTARVQLLEPVAEGDVAASLASADVHLLSLSAEWQGVIVPSKLQGAFAVARPVILVGASESETAVWIRESDGGWVVGENDVEGLLRAVSEASDPAESRRRGLRGQEYARVHFDPVHNKARIADLLERSASPVRIGAS